MNFQNDINKCLRVLEAGGTILYPTDTVWGIGCDATNAEAVARIFSLKQRAEAKSMIILLANEKNIKNYAAVPPDELRKTIRESEKPVTVIYPHAKNFAKNLIAADGTIAIRIVRDQFCSVLIGSFGNPIVSTSANISGEAAPGNFSAVSPKIIAGVDHVVQHRQNEESPSTPSRIVKWDEEEGLIVIRE